jgi:hypothetical protein
MPRTFRDLLAPGYCDSTRADLGKQSIMRNNLRATTLLILIGSVLPFSACSRQGPSADVEGTMLDAAGKPVDKVRDGLPPIETRAAASEPTPLAEQQRRAHRLLEKLWGGGALGNRCYWLSSAMRRIDPELALRWAIDGKGDCADFIRAAMAEQMADKDFDEALGLIAQSEGWGLNALIRLARRYTASDPAKALRCVEELVVGGRAFDQPWRAGYLAQAGALAIRLGKSDAGQKLLDEAGAMAAKLGSEQAHAAARGMVAEALAPSDLGRALKLIEPITPMNSPDRCRAHVAVAICLQNLDGALAILEKSQTGGYDDRGRLRIAQRLAPTRPADATRVAEMIGRQGSDGIFVKATALARVAAAMAPHDKRLAWSVVDRALGMLMAPGALENSLELHGGRPAGAGFVALQARQIGYPDMQSIVQRVLACRPGKKTISAIRHASDENVVASRIIMATFLGLVDPRTAREILASVEAVHPSSKETVRVAWIKAWLAVDPARGDALFAELADSIRGKPGKDEDFYGLVEAAQLLAAPWAEKAQYIVSYPDYRDEDAAW